MASTTSILNNIDHITSCRSQEAGDDNATDSTDSNSTNTQDTTPTQHCIQKEVSYKNATDMFRNIENNQWSTVLEFCREDSPQVKIWVKNQGSENTTFEWSLWKRLPIHEACRRQPPAWLISAMLTSYPASAYCKTHFGQLPLHCAVECGASPEVVNLLVVANWHGVLEMDNSGRTPLEILEDAHETSALEKEDRLVLKGSLERSTKTLREIHQKNSDAMRRMEDAHDHQVKTMEQSHAKAMQKEYERQEALEQSLKSIEALVDTLKTEMHMMEQTIASHIVKENEWKDRTNHYQGRLQDSQAENTAHIEHVSALKDLVSKKDATIARLERQIKLLHKDLIDITLGHDDKLMVQYQEVETDLRAMLESQVKLKTRLTGHSKALHALLKERFIELPPPPPPPEPPVEEEEPEPPKDLEAPQRAAEAANAAAAAALAALNLSEQDQ